MFSVCYMFQKKITLNFLQSNPSDHVEQLHKALLLVRVGATQNRLPPNCLRNQREWTVFFPAGGVLEEDWGVSGKHASCNGMGRSMTPNWLHMAKSMNLPESVPHINLGWTYHEKIQPIKKGSGMSVTLKLETLKTYNETNSYKFQI